ncbi:winged helix-turn-helix domain-containing protein [Parvularcula maris]|uniref:Winged helix-turn-helix domain-containing protein n=1 Tax=Parvularcula maris TaxID=2965077 RepID=A0A9X2RIS9_9PROT|nr:winged helix-turn-helix domain-containing protein [Parvularcula maris]
MERKDERLFAVGREGLPSLPGMMLATLNALRAIGGSGSIQEIADEVVELESISEEEQAFPHKDGRSTRLDYYLAWARTYLKRGGAVDNSARGVWTLTDKGEKITGLDETKAIYEQVQSEERERARRKRQARKDAGAPEPKGNEAFAFDDDDPVPDVELSDDWRSELLTALRSMDPSAFERLAQRLLREAGSSGSRCAARPATAASMASASCA